MLIDIAGAHNGVNNPDRETTGDHDCCDAWLGDTTGDSRGDKTSLGATANDNYVGSTLFGVTIVLAPVTPLNSVIPPVIQVVTAPDFLEVIARR